MNRNRIATVQSSGAHGAWTAQGLARLLDGGFAAGYVTHRGQLVSGAHQPLITAEVWAAYRAHRKETRYNPRQSVDDFLVADMVWCVCGSRMSAVHVGAPSYCRYQCRKHPPKRPGQSMIHTRLDGMVRSWLTALVADPAVRDRADGDAGAWADRQIERGGEVRAQIGPGLPPAAERSALLEELETVRGRAVAPLPSAAATALLEDWDVLDGPARRRRLGGLIHRVTVENIRPTPLLHITTTWGTVMPWTGVQAGRHLLTRPESPALSTAVEQAADSAADPLLLLTPAEAARITGVKVHTVRSWDIAGYLPQTQIAADGGDRRYAIQDLRRMRARYKTDGVWIPLKASYPVRVLGESDGRSASS